MGQSGAASDAGDVAAPTVALISVAAYTAYRFLVRICGAIHGAQAACVSTFTGLLFSVLMLGERSSPPIWLAALHFAVGLALVRPLDIGQSN